MIQPFLVAALSVIPQPTQAWEQGETIPVTSPIVVKKDAAIAAEGYVLDVNPSGTVTITCSDDAGAFYARQTLKQITDWRGYACAKIRDQPAYRWRGMLIDECRHFFGKDVLKKTLDVMAQYKLNVLHWHLTEDQGWRLDIPGYPELVKYGAVRPASPKFGARMHWDADGNYVRLSQEYEPCGMSLWQWRSDALSLEGATDKAAKEKQEILDLYKSLTPMSSSFSFDKTNVEDEVANYNAVFDEYYKPLQYGLVDDVEGQVKLFLEKAEQAGLSKIQEEYIKQYTAWAEANK